MASLSTPLLILLFLHAFLFLFCLLPAIGKKYDDYEMEQEAYWERVKQSQAGLLGFIASDPVIMAESMMAKDNTDLIYQPKSIFDQYGDAVPMRVKPRRKNVGQRLWGGIKRIGAGVVRAAKTPWRMWSNYKDQKRADKIMDKVVREIQIKRKTNEFIREHMWNRPPALRRQSFGGFAGGGDGDGASFRLRRGRSWRY